MENQSNNERLLSQNKDEISAADDFREYLASLSQPRTISLSDAFDAYLAGAMNIDAFDTELWFAVLDMLDKKKDRVDLLPVSVQFFYSSRYLEWEVANGGFAQAAFNIPQLFPLAREGYSVLGLTKAVKMIARAEKYIAEGEAEFKTPCGGDIGELFEEFLDSKLSKLKVRQDSEFWATEQRVAYAVKNRNAFEI